MNAVLVRDGSYYEAEKGTILLVGPPERRLIVFSINNEPAVIFGGRPGLTVRNNDKVIVISDKTTTLIVFAESAEQARDCLFKIGLDVRTTVTADETVVQPTFTDEIADSVQFLNQVSSATLQETVSMLLQNPAFSHLYEKIKSMLPT